MKAIVCDRYGSPNVLELKNVEIPTPKANEVLVEVYGASVNAYDWHLMSAKPFLVRLGAGFFRPRNRFTGADVAGRVAAVGADVQGSKPGDEVYGEISHGAFAEYVSVREELLAPKPANLSFEESAAIPMAALTALQGLRDVGRIRPGLKVLINGASGGVGTFAVQIAKSFGAEVTAVCSTKKVELARSLGADRVIDYTRENFTTSADRYDLILGVNGFYPISAYKRVLTDDGLYAMAGGSDAQIFQALLLGSLSGKTTIVSAKANRDDLLAITELVEAGKVRPVIDKHYSLEQVPEAIGYVQEGHAAGKVVITVKNAV